MTAPSLARILTDAGAFVDEPFTLIDVGCSGGIFNPVLEFAPSLKAVGFDPITDEVDRLQATTPDEGVRFECALVGEPGWELPTLRSSPGVFARSSASAYGEMHSFNYGKEINNAGRAITLTNRRVALVDWLSAHPDWAVDFLKVDTDGSDISVLRSMGERITEPLAVHVEVNFDGDTGPNRNVFSTVFDTLITAGYRLFSLDPTRYAKATMPLPFRWRMPAQTSSGQVMQADALFCRDLAVEGEGTPTRLLKLACIFDLLDLQDCAAELLEAHAPALAGVSPVPIPALLTALGRRTELGLAPGEARVLLRDTPQVFFPTVEQNGSGGAMVAGQHADTPPTSLALDSEPIALGTGRDRTVAPLGDGWTIPEVDGVWTDAPCADLRVTLVDTVPRGSLVALNGWSLAENQGEAPCAVVINGTALEPIAGVPDGECRYRVPRDIGPGPAVISIHAWPLIRPCDVIDSSDQRLLGVHVSSLAIRADPRASDYDA